MELVYELTILIIPCNGTIVLRKGWNELFKRANFPSELKINFKFLPHSVYIPTTSEQRMSCGFFKEFLNTATGIFEKDISFLRNFLQKTETQLELMRCLVYTYCPIIMEKLSNKLRKEYDADCCLFILPHFPAILGALTDIGAQYIAISDKGITLTSPHEIYSFLYAKLTGKKEEPHCDNETCLMYYLMKSRILCSNCKEKLRRLILSKR